MRWLSGWLAGCSAALVLAACGGGSDAARLPSSYAGPAAARAGRVARLVEADRLCAASALAVRLQADTIDAVNAGRIPPALQEELLGRTNLVVAFVPCGAMERQTGRDPAAEARALARWLRDH